jgi:glyoxylase-like metal-dependent hydrolase (beta-lactamase superfamily II)
LRLVVQTHSHNDHIACNVALKKQTGCLIAGHKHYAHWHSDLERHFQEWSRPIPELMPDSPDVRAYFNSLFDAPHHIDIFVDEGTVFDLGGGVTLTGYSVPGHMLNDIAWFESSTRTLLLGDGITATEWPHFHMHLTVSGYRNTIPKVQRLVRELKVENVFLTHFGVIKPSDLFMLCEKSTAFLDKMDRSLLQVLSSKDFVSLEEIWKTVATKMNKYR